MLQSTRPRGWSASERTEAVPSARRRAAGPCSIGRLGGRLRWFAPGGVGAFGDGRETCVVGPLPCEEVGESVVVDREATVQVVAVKAAVVPVRSVAAETAGGSAWPETFQGRRRGVRAWWPWAFGPFVAALGWRVGLSAGSA